MNFQQLRALGVGLGMIVMVVCGMYLWITYKQGNPNWYMLVMICGMAILLVNTVGKKRRR